MAAEPFTTDFKVYLMDLAAAAGGVADIADDDILDLALPQEVAARAGLAEFFTVALSRDAADETQGAEYVTYGSAILDSLVEMGLDTGRALRLHAALTSASMRVPPNLMQWIDSSIGFEKCRRPSMESTAIELHQQVVFTFVVSYVSDEKFTDDIMIAVDRHTLGDDTDLLDSQVNVYFADAGAGRVDAADNADAASAADAQTLAHPRPLLHPHSEVAAVAAGILEESALPQHMGYQRQAALYCRQELSKLLRYYHETIGQLKSREESTTDADRRRRLAAKIQATLAEKERRSVDLIERYRVHATARLDSAAVRIMPKVRARLQVQHMRETLHQDVFYNLASSSIEPIACPICHRRSAVMYPANTMAKPPENLETDFVCPRHVD
ncbi:MAG TPA: hypothetical protein DDZ84_02355 [Firmicutes bacterium]|jgi:hypothetical protein|nr:hypothetical protein [Bacillota bacterium]